MQQADDAAYHSPRGSPGEGPLNHGPAPRPDPIDGHSVHGTNDRQPPPPLDPKVKQQIDSTPPPKFSDETNAALLRTGNHPDAISKLQQATDATGTSVAVPGGGNPEHQKGVVDGQYAQKPMGMDTKSMATTGDIPLNAAGGKMGDTRKRLAAEYVRARDAARKPGASPEQQQAMAAALENLQTANKDIKAATQQNRQGIKDGKWRAIYDKTSKTKVMHAVMPDGSVKKIKPDIDPISTNANRGVPKPQINKYQRVGNCTAAEARWHQAAAHSQGQNAITNHASDVNSPHGPKPLANEMVFLTPGKPPQVVRGADNIVKHMDSLGMDVHQNWRDQAALAASAKPSGQASRGLSPDWPVALPHQLPQIHVESRDQYLRVAWTTSRYNAGAQGTDGNQNGTITAAFAAASSTPAWQAARSPSTDRPMAQQHQLQQTRIESRNQVHPGGADGLPALPRRPGHRGGAARHSARQP